MGVFRGLFQGRKTMMPTAVSQIFEQIVNAFVSVAAAYMLMRSHSASPKLAAWGAAGGTMGTLFGAVVALVILTFIYLLYRPVMKKQMRRDHVSKKETLGITYRLIFCTVVPIILSQTVYQLSGIIDVTLFNVVMDGKGHSGTSVSTMLGIYSTSYRTLVSVPIAISTAMASSMVPGLVTSYMQKDTKGMERKISITIKFNMLVAFPCAMGLGVLAEPIIRLIYPHSNYQVGAIMLMTGSSCVIFYALSTVTSGVLQSIDRMNLPVLHSLASLIVHVVAVYALLEFTNLGVYALVFGNVTYPLLVCYLNGKSVRRYLGFRQEVTKTFCIPLLASFVMGVAAYGVYQAFFALTHRIYIAIFPAVAVAVLIYFALVLKLGGVSRSELYEFPMGRRMSMAADKFGLLND
jgi:stage V sporulation protein B